MNHVRVPGSVSERFSEVLTAASAISTNPYLQFATRAVQGFDDAAAHLPMGKFKSRMLELLSDPAVAIDGSLTNEFFQVLGEANFQVLCSRKGVDLNSIPQASVQTPDFELLKPELMHFEVKTLSVVGGDSAVDETLEQFACTRDELHAQSAAGKQIAITETVVQPFGKHRAVRGVARALLEKVRANIKSGQYVRKDTFLVIDLSMLSEPPAGLASLCQTYPDPLVPDAFTSGILWLVAFGELQTNVWGFCDFEGAENDEGQFDKQGVLLAPEYQGIRGIVVVTHPWNREPMVALLIRDADRRKNAASGVGAVLKALAGDAWNDELNTNRDCLLALSR